MDNAVGVTAFVMGVCMGTASKLRMPDQRLGLLFFGPCAAFLVVSALIWSSTHKTAVVHVVMTPRITQVFGARDEAQLHARPSDTVSEFDELWCTDLAGKPNVPPPDGRWIKWGDCRTRIVAAYDGQCYSKAYEKAAAGQRAAGLLPSNRSSAYLDGCGAWIAQATVFEGNSFGIGTEFRSFNKSMGWTVYPAAGLALLGALLMLGVWRWVERISRWVRAG